MLFRLLAARSARNPAVVVVLLEIDVDVFPISSVSRKVLLLRDLAFVGGMSGFRSLLDVLDFDISADFSPVSLLPPLLPVRECVVVDLDCSSLNLVSEVLRSLGTELCRRDVREAFARSMRGREDVDIIS